MTENIFNKIDEPKVQSENETSKNDEMPITNEITSNKLSNTPVGEERKYERESLDGQTVSILSVKLFNADIETENPITSLTNPETKYYKSKFIITFDKKNNDGMNNREYLSGVTQFLQKDGSLASPSFWYKGARNQIAKLFEKVAEFKKIEPEELSSREFIDFLNSGIKVVIKYEKIEYLNNVFYKNIITKIVG